MARTEKVFLVGVHVKSEKKNLLESRKSLEELGLLAQTVGGTVVGECVQSLESPVSATLIGKGKVSELEARYHRGEFNTLIFDEELKPAQHKNLTEIIPAKILDRTRLILDIFAKRARTKEGLLQVEMAQLSYLLPRMTERYGRFEQQVGGIGTRGPGERKLEVESRHIRDRMARIKKEIESVRTQREVARERRVSIPLPTVALVGYTNAGKSTLLNKLVELHGNLKDPVYADNKLFATLDPTTRRVRLPSSRWALFTDTVGFIKKLPTHLVAAFRATLEETLNADLWVHVIDATDPNRKEHAKTVIEILEKLGEDENGVDSAPPIGAQGRFNRNDDQRTQMILVYNKMDRAPKREWAALLNEGSKIIEEPITLAISASTGLGLDPLLEAVEEKLSREMVEKEIVLPYSKMSALSSLYRLGKVEKLSSHSHGLKLNIKLERSHYLKLKRILHDSR